MAAEDSVGPKYRNMSTTMLNTNKATREHSEISKHSYL